MSKRKAENTRMKRKYLIWRQEAKGWAEATVDRAAAAIDTYITFLKGKDFRSFHSEQARAFKQHLRGQKHPRTGAPLSATTANGTLREVKAFFEWLADQPGYKSKITRSEVAYLSPDRKSEEARRTTCWKPHPSLFDAARVLQAMPTETPFQRRDRGLFALLFLTGSRISAAISLRLAHVDLGQRVVHFDGRTVDTKFGKSFSTAFFPVGETFSDTFLAWLAELREIGFSHTDPLFPKTQVGYCTDRKFGPVGFERAPWSSTGTASKIFKTSFERIGLPPYSPHRVRDTIAELAREHCATPEDYKAWSQNMGHDDVLTTFRSYGSVAPGRQAELMARFWEKG